MRERGQCNELIGRYANFSTIMASHAIPMKSSSSSYVRTGYESVLALRASDKFVIHAEQDGKITDITPQYVKGVYKDGTQFKYSIKKWASKEEAGATYTHKMIPALGKNKTFKIGDTIVYDPIFFEKDIFDPGKVVYKTSTNMRIALLEDIQTFEDSCTLSKRMSKKTGIEVTKVKSFVLNTSDIIANLVNIGDKIDANDPLFTIVDKYVAHSAKTLDKKTLELLKALKNNSPKAKYKGVIDNIVIMYNAEPDEISKSVQELIDISDKRLKVDKGFIGKVDSTYSVAGNKLMPGTMEIKVYIITKENSGIGDKFIIGGQLKCTVSEVTDYEIYTADTNTEIDMTFSMKAINARVVNSVFITGMAGKALEALANKAIEEYFG